MKSFILYLGIIKQSLLSGWNRPYHQGCREKLRSVLNVYLTRQISATCRIGATVVVTRWLCFTATLKQDCPFNQRQRKFDLLLHRPDGDSADGRTANIYSSGWRTLGTSIHSAAGRPESLRGRCFVHDSPSAARRLIHQLLSDQLTGHDQSHHHGCRCLHMHRVVTIALHELSEKWDVERQRGVLTLSLSLCIVDPANAF